MKNVASGYVPVFLLFVRLKVNDLLAGKDALRVAA